MKEWIIGDPFLYFYDYFGVRFGLFFGVIAT
jgi:hypothetical protein